MIYFKNERGIYTYIRTVYDGFYPIFIRRSFILLPCPCSINGDGLATAHSRLPPVAERRGSRRFDVSAVEARPRLLPDRAVHVGRQATALRCVGGCVRACKFGLRRSLAPGVNTPHSRTLYSVTMSKTWTRHWSILPTKAFLPRKACASVASTASNTPRSHALRSCSGA